MHATARRTVSVTLAVSAALALGACSPGGSGSSAAPTVSSVATPPSTAATAPQSPATSAVAASGTACKSLVTTATVKDAVTRAYAEESQLAHLAPGPGSFLYGECDGVTYAASRFDPTAGATLNEKVALQDAGSVRKYFSRSSSGSWTYVGSAGFPDKGGCISQIPGALATIWTGCPNP